MAMLLTGEVMERPCLSDVAKSLEDRRLSDILMLQPSSTHVPFTSFLVRSGIPKVAVDANGKIKSWPEMVDSSTAIFYLALVETEEDIAAEANRNDDEEDAELHILLSKKIPNALPFAILRRLSTLFFNTDHPRFDELLFAIAAAPACHLNLGIGLTEAEGYKKITALVDALQNLPDGVVDGLFLQWMDL